MDRPNRIHTSMSPGKGVRGDPQRILTWLLLGLFLLPARLGGANGLLAEPPDPQPPAQREALLSAPPGIAEADGPYTSPSQPLPGWPSWSASDASRLVTTLEKAHEEGLDPSAYPVEEIESLLAASRPEEKDKLRQVLTRAVLDYATDSLFGRTDPSRSDSEWHIRAPKPDPFEVLGNASAPGELGAFLRRLAPPHRHFRRLRLALARHRAIAERGGWPVLPRGTALRKGVRGPRVRVLRRRLTISGDLVGGEDGSELFDEATEAAVTRFQTRHGLAADGIVGSDTRFALNVSVEDRIRQILLNIERLRWMPWELGDRYVLVNLAGFELGAFEQGRRVLRMNVIVGRPHRATPCLDAKMTHVVFNPYWSVPRRIATRDILPKILEDPGYLAERGIRVYHESGPAPGEVDPAVVDWQGVGQERFRFRLRQDPGPRNALGRMKFVVPNRFDVYLHDTPDRDLFAAPVRAFSSGCIRVERPFQLAAYLLRGDLGWSPEVIQAAVESGRSQWIRFPEATPVYTVYWTAWVDRDGTVQFRDDLYGRDARLEQALAEVEASPSTSPVPDAGPEVPVSRRSEGLPEVDQGADRGTGVSG